MLPKIFVVGLICCTTARAADDMNAAVIRTAEQMERDLGGRGYDLHSSFTEDLRYGGQCCVRATNYGKTMCVALVTEVLLRTLDRLGAKNKQIFSEFPISQFQKSQYLNIRPHLYQYKGVDSRGPGDALSRFGIGQNVMFDAMKAGDLLAFSRFNGSGHSVVFLRYLGPRNETIANYSPSVIGFEYFSAQNSTNGVGRRMAYFGNIGKTSCPAIAPLGSDCGIIRGNYMNAGRLWDPSNWTVAASIDALKKQFALKAASGGAVSTTMIEKMLTEEIPEVFDVDFDE